MITEEARQYEQEWREFKVERFAWLNSMGKTENDVEKDRETGKEFFFNEWLDENGDEHLIRIFLPFTLQIIKLH